MLAVKNINLNIENKYRYTSIFLPAFHSTLSYNKFNKLSEGHVVSVSFSNLCCVYCFARYNLVIVCRDQSVRDKYIENKNEINNKEIVHHLSKGCLTKEILKEGPFLLKI